MWTIFKVPVEFVNSIASVLRFGFLAKRHVGSYLYNQGLNLHPLLWKASCYQWTPSANYFIHINIFPTAPMRWAL